MIKEFKAVIIVFISSRFFGTIFSKNGFKNNFFEVFYGTGFIV